MWILVLKIKRLRGFFTKLYAVKSGSGRVTAKFLLTRREAQDFDPSTEITRMHGFTEELDA
jgi:hypothetical protein